jgi:hypothetical protein
MGQSEEHAGEHIRNLWNRLETNWKLDRNMLGNPKKSNIPTLPQVPWVYAIHLIGCHGISVPTCVLYHFWPRLMSGTEFWDRQGQWRGGMTTIRQVPEVTATASAEFW